MWRPASMSAPSRAPPAIPAAASSRSTCWTTPRSRATSAPTPMAGSASRWNGITDLASGVGAVAPREGARELGAQQEDLRRIEDPEQQDDERARRAIGRGRIALDGIRAVHVLATIEQSGRGQRADDDVTPGVSRAGPAGLDSGKQSSEQRAGDRDVGQLQG